MNKHVKYLEEAIEVSKKARESGNTPFGALLADKDGNILLRQGNVELTEHRCTGHAETALAEKASQLYSKEFLAECTLYTTVEPCAMCTGAIYWANIGAIVYGMEESDLLKMTGNNEVNPTFNMPCRTILAAGQKDIQVTGPFKELEESIAEVHRGFWD
ncbi:nucleoside deaminase [Eubacteriaceae bacterium ES3]|nr:nucleoside deaminase [Eubacteriaceae bacterium ES3]